MVCCNNFGNRCLVDNLRMEINAMKTTLVCDIETNNDSWPDGKPRFDFFKDDPIQIAFGIYQDRQKVCEDELFLKTPNLRPTIEKFTGITKQMLDEKGMGHRAVAGIWKDIFRNYSPDVVVGHNLIAFDWVILTNWLLRTLEGENFILPVVPALSDTMKRGSLWIHGVNGKWPKLKDLAKALGIMVNEAKLHNALYDIELCAKVHFQLEDLCF